MSYILDALRKADQERTIGDVPDLATAHWTRRRALPVRNWVWVAIALLLANVLLVTLLFVKDDDAPSRPGISSQLTDPQQEKPLRQALEAPPQPASVPPARERAPLRVATPTPRAVVTAPPPRPAAVARPRVAQPAPQERVRPGTTEIPEWNELSLKFRRDFDPPKLDVHVYDEDASRRFILVQLKRYQEGDSLNGAILEKILPGSIQLTYRGTRFRIDR